MRGRRASYLPLRRRIDIPTLLLLLLILVEVLMVVVLAVRFQEHKLSGVPVPAVSDVQLVTR